MPIDNDYLSFHIYSLFFILTSTFKKDLKVNFNFLLEVNMENKE